MMSELLHKHVYGVNFLAVNVQDFLSFYHFWEYVAVSKNNSTVANDQELLVLAC